VIATHFLRSVFHLVLNDSRLSNEFIDLQPAVTSNNQTPLSEDDKNSIRNLLNSWNLANLFQTCLSEYKLITSIA
jgi:hypothetical protein